MRPPPLAEWLLSRFAPRRIRDAVLGDLREEYARYAVTERGPRRAWLWYWKQVLAVLSHYRSPRRELLAWARDGVPRTLAALVHAAAALARTVQGSGESLWRDRAYALGATLVLAVGIGSGATAFTAVRGVLLAPLPYDHPKRLVEIGGRLPGVLGRDVAASAPEYRDYLRRARSIDGLAATLSLGASVTDRGRAVPVQAVLTTPNLFSLLGVSPALGRDFEVGDVRSTLGDVAILSYRAWVEFLSGDPRAIGRTLRVDGDPITVIGVAPRDFRHPGASDERPVELWMPMGLEEGSLLDGRGGRTLTLLGRLRNGYSVAGSQAEFHSIARELERAHPEYYPPKSGWDVAVIPLQRQIVGSARGTLLLLMGAVGLVLLVSCASVANLVTSRGGQALRSGERTPQVAALLLAGEGLVLTAVGAVVALPLAWLGTESLKRAAAADVPRLLGAHFDGSALWYVYGASLLAFLVCCVAPAVRLLVADPVRSGQLGPATPRPSGNRLRDVLAAAPLVGALVLCVTAGLMVMSFQHLVALDPGFDEDRVLTLQTRLPVPNDPRTGRFFDVDRRIAFFDRALEEMRALPNVLEAGVVSHLPMRGRNGWTFGIVGQECDARAGLPTLEFRVASPSYFGVMRIGLVRGRHLAPSDDRRSPYVVTVNQALAARYFPNRDPIGQRLVLGGPDGRRAEIVGVIESVRDSALDAAPRPAAYASHRQHVGVDMTFVLKTDTQPEAVAAAAADAVRRVAHDVPVFTVASMREIVARTVAQRRFLTWLLALLAVLAVPLAGAGAPSAMAAAAPHDGPAERTLPASGRFTPRRRLGTALRYGTRPAVLGASAGLLGTLGVAELLASPLSEIGRLDPVVYGGGAALFLTVAIAGACLCRSAGRRHAGRALAAPPTRP